MKIKLQNFASLAVAAIYFVFLSTAASADRADECISDWEVVIEAYNDAVDDANRGWQNVIGAPSSAFDSFNSAASTASTYWRNFGGCPDVTTLTERDIDDWDRDRRGLVRDAECGMEVAAMESRVVELDDYVDRYNNDRVLADRVVLAARVLESSARDALSSYECDNDGWAKDLARDRISWAREVQSALQ